jgi:hypothetical protein
MARGFESKDVEFQQAEAERKATVARPLTAAERDRGQRQRTIELSLARARNELENAVHQDHRAMLHQAVLDLERQLVSVDMPLSSASRDKS